MALGDSCARKASGSPKPADGETGAGGGEVAGGDAAVHGAGQRIAQGQPEAHALRACGVERREQPRQRIGRDAGAGVADGEQVFLAVRAAFDLDVARAGGVSQRIRRVLDQVVQDLLQRHAVA
ncbi:hypothetical protein G6F31_016098 [Rhizopus arrhizus]|nr:hypothetical protein G6F31_016098 [Rhizopus arrhizus]